MHASNPESNASFIYSIDIHKQKLCHVFLENIIELDHDKTCFAKQAIVEQAVQQWIQATVPPSDASEGLRLARGFKVALPVGNGCANSGSYSNEGLTVEDERRVQI